MQFALKHYEFVLANLDRMSKEFDEARAAGRSFEEFAAEKFDLLAKAIPAKHP